LLLGTRLLPLLVLVALLFRLYFYIVLVSGDPQDDGLYYQNALDIFESGPTYLERYRNLPADFLANPVDQFNFRPLTTYPSAFAFRVFGPGEGAAVLWSLACSMLSMAVVYRLATLLEGPVAGLFAAFLVAIYPLDVVLATRILSDGPVGCFCGLGVLGAFSARATTEQRAMWAYFSGIAFGLGYLANPRALLVLGLVIVLTASTIGVAVRSWRTPAWLLFGFATVFLAEAAIYFWTTGHPFLNLEIHNGASTFKYLHEPVTAWRWGPLEVHFTNGRPLQISQTVFHLRSAPTDLFGLYFFLFAAAVADAVLRRQYLFVATLGLALFAFLEFGFVGIHLNLTKRVIEYWMVFKQERFLTILTVPLIALSACFLASTARRHPFAVTGMLILLTMTSVRAIDGTYAFYRAGLSDLRTVAGDVLGQPDRIFHTDPWAETHLRIFTQYRAHNLRGISREDGPYLNSDACVIVGGSRGVELLADYVEGVLPPWARQLLSDEQPSADWKLVRLVSGPRSAQRLHDLRIYCRSSRD